MSWWRLGLFRLVTSRRHPLQPNDTQLCMGYNADSRGHPSARDRVRSSMRTQINTLQKPGLFGFKNSNPEGESSADTLFEDAGETAHRFFNSEERDYNLL